MSKKIKRAWVASTVAVTAVMLLAMTDASASQRYQGWHKWHRHIHQAQGHHGQGHGTTTTVAPTTTTVKVTTPAPPTTPKPTTTTTGAPTTTVKPATTTTTKAPDVPPPATANGKNCAAKPSACGYPDETNTGVPAGTALKAVPGDVTSGQGWHWDSRGWVQIDGDGAVFSGYSMTSGNIDVTASNVTISNNRLMLKGDGWGIGLRGAKNATIRNNTISSPAASGKDRLGEGIRDINGNADGVQIIGNDISHIDSGINHFDAGGLIQDNYIHDMIAYGDDHVNGIQLGSGTGPLMTIRHNTIFNPVQQTDCIMLATDDGPQTNRLIDNNLLAGGGYTVYGAGGPQDVPTNIRFTNNRFSKKFYPNGGFFGPVAYFVSNGAGNVWLGNIWDDTLAPVN